MTKPAGKGSPALEKQLQKNISCLEERLSAVEAWILQKTSTTRWRIPAPSLEQRRIAARLQHLRRAQFN
ncbi:hypothetical protein [Noviherbaspirillum massiliense]|uniref:hypothetical protein n=1 Tax=Noviherbaspirillum massiliense TaxID=1465823 RepID=UPI0003067F8C|nr:hypothetical protein [Noviherbaspirillum massiliense]